MATKGTEYLLLKWGTLKGWKLHSTDTHALIEEYLDIGASASVMMQKDNERQKQIILELIDKVDGSIQNDWDGNQYSKDQAKEYILNYGKKTTTTP